MPDSIAVWLQNDRMCGVLIMDQTGVVGLDLSFASWVFLMEPLEDISVHQQVVSRAHRMGAKQPVHLETLVMKVSPVTTTITLLYQPVSP